MIQNNTNSDKKSGSTVVKPLHQGYNRHTGSFVCRRLFFCYFSFCGKRKVRNGDAIYKVEACLLYLETHPENKTHKTQQFTTKTLPLLGEPVPLQARGKGWVSRNKTIQNDTERHKKPHLPYQPINIFTLLPHLPFTHHPILFYKISFFSINSRHFQ